MSEYSKEYYTENRSKCIAYSKAYYKRNREKMLEQDRTRRGCRNEYYRIKGKRYVAEHPDRFYYKKLRERSVKKGIEYLDFNSFRTLFSNFGNICTYCGIILVFSSKNKEFSPSIDRKDNSRGYVADNICICCVRCNRLKSDFFTYEQFKEIAEKYIKQKVFVAKVA